MRGLRRDDDGQLMLLAGIVLTSSFVLTALTLSQVSALQREAAAAIAPPIIGEWRFLHERVASSVESAAKPDTPPGEAGNVILAPIKGSFHALLADRGYDLQIRFAGGDDFVANGNEAALVSGLNYNAWSIDGKRHFNYPIADDGNQEDGVLYGNCPMPGSPPKCILGVYLFLSMTDGVTSMEESILFAANVP